MTNRFIYTSSDQQSIDMLTRASAAEAEAVSAVWRAARAASTGSTEESLSDEKESESQLNDNLPPSDDSDATDSLEPGVRLHPRAVDSLIST